MPNLGKATIKVLVERAYTAGLLAGVERAWRVAAVEEELAQDEKREPMNRTKMALLLDHVQREGELPEEA